MAYINGNKILNVMVNGTLSNVDEKVAEAYEAGREKERELEWKRFTGNGERIYYSYAFAYADYTGYEFYEPVVPTDNIGNMFHKYSGAGLPKNIDLSKGATSTASRTRVFYYCNATEIDCMGIVAGKYIETFSSCRKAKKITGFNVNASSTFDNTFYRCDVLEEIEINGEIGTDISFSSSPLLKVGCINDIISHLKDYAGTGTTHTLTLGTTNLAKLSDTEKAVATTKGWTLA